MAESESKGELAYQPVTIENLHFVRYKCNLNLDNLKMTDENLAVKEAMYFKLAGGNTILELLSMECCSLWIGLMNADGACIGSAHFCDIVKSS